MQRYEPLSTSKSSAQAQPDLFRSGEKMPFRDNRPGATVQLQLQEMAANSPYYHGVMQLQTIADAHVERLRNNTGIPDQLKNGAEALSGISLDEVKVHYQSSKPAQLHAHAYAQGNDIHVAPGQERHLPHEVWHVIQQKQGRVQPTAQLKGKAGVAINDDKTLEKEADEMGLRSLNVSGITEGILTHTTQRMATVAQCYRIQHNVKISDNNLYRIDQANTHQLQVAPRALGPQPAHLFHIVGQTPDGYDIYEFNGNYENDCLRFAEYLSTGKYAKASAFRAKGDKQLKNDKDRLFGQSDAQNLNISELARVNGKKRKSEFSQAEEANPAIGEAYSIVRGKLEANQCPFHIAYVVANDGGDNVTCEADASDEHRNTPVFDMYATPQKKKAKGGVTNIVTEGKTFHDTYKKSYTTAGKKKIPAVTGVLTAK